MYVFSPLVQKWPKVKSRLRVVFGYELWNGHMKEVESHFGTAVVSYFVFLRWLFLMNLIIFALWFGLAVIPQLVWVAGTNAPRSPSQLACIFNLTDAPRVCPDMMPNLSLLLTPEFLSPRRLVCEGGEVAEGEERFDVKECDFDREDGVYVARREHPDNMVSVVANCTDSITE